MASKDGRREVAVAVAMTSNKATVKATLRSSSTSPKNLFHLPLNDKRIGITDEDMPAFKRNLAKLLPKIRKHINALPHDSSVTVETLAALVQLALSGEVQLAKRPTRPPKKKGRGGGQSQSTASRQRAQMKALLRRLATKPLSPSAGGLLPRKKSLTAAARPSSVRSRKDAPPAKKAAKRGRTSRRERHDTRSRTEMKPGFPLVFRVAAKRSSSRDFARPMAIDLKKKKKNGFPVKKTKKASTKKAARAPRKAVVSTGFAPHSHPGKPINKNLSLSSDGEYYFWLQVGVPVFESIETAETSLPTEHLPELPRLKVALFDFGAGLRIIPGSDVGEIQLEADDTAVVVRQPGKLDLPPDSDLGQKRLFFPVKTSRETGRFQLRCNIYYEQVLVQSRLIQARVMRRAKESKGGLGSTVDYTLSKTLSPAYVSGMEPHRLSLMLNDNGNGTHGFRFFGDHEFKSDASFDGHELQDWITQARETLRSAAWGDKNPWQPGRAYLYSGPLDQKRLKTDLVRFAKAGYTFYDSIIDRLTGDVDRSDELAALMRTPGLIQIALKRSARNVLPAALIYDYGLETNLPAADYKLCPSFLADFQNAAKNLEDSKCFKGDCPTKDATDVVCPSGFWGYRHSLGMPLSLKDDAGAPTELSWKGQPELTVAVSTDQAFVMRAKHEEAIKALRPMTWNYGATRADVLKLLKDKNPQLVYFYCHGGIAGTLPFIKVGPSTEVGITRDNLRREKIRWKSLRPLVFINGCHTAALEPDAAIEFISAFVEVAGACGVIGTEITIFEPLAKAFAEECLRRFLNGDKIGDAVRGARLKLLKDGNPLGLVYIPYVIANLHLVQQN